MLKYTPPSEESEEEEEEQPKKKKKKPKAKKDPNKPKRAMSSFMFFASDKRPEVKQLFPDLKVTQIGKKLSEMWKEIDAEKKKVYEEKAAGDKLRFTDAMAKYKPQEEEPEGSSSSSSSESASDSEST